MTEGTDIKRALYFSTIDARKDFSSNAAYGMLICGQYKGEMMD
jgi:hypothetical protein